MVTVIIDSIFDKVVVFNMLNNIFELKLSSVRMMISLGFFAGCLLNHTHLIRFFLVTVLMQLVKGWEVGWFFILKKLGLKKILLLVDLNVRLLRVLLSSEHESTCVTYPVRPIWEAMSAEVLKVSFCLKRRTSYLTTSQSCSLPRCYHPWCPSEPLLTCSTH